MEVTQIKPLTKTKFCVYVDGTSAFALYKGEIAKYHLKAGEELPQKTYEEILENVLLKRAKLRAMHLLNDMDRTEDALRTKLEQGLFPPAVIEQAIDYVKSFGYIDDYRYARNLVDSRREQKSKRELYALLCQKGVSSEIIDQVFEEYYNAEDELTVIRKLLDKRRFCPDTADERELQRIYGYLARKGFHYEKIRQVVQNYNTNT